MKLQQLGVVWLSMASSREGLDHLHASDHIDGVYQLGQMVLKRRELDRCAFLAASVNLKQGHLSDAAKQYLEEQIQVCP